MQKGKARAKASQKVTEEKRKVEKRKLDDEENTMAERTTDDEALTPKPKKARIRDEINIVAAKGIKFAPSKQVAPALEAPQSQLQAAGNSRKLKREGAITDIAALYKNTSPANPIDG